MIIALNYIMYLNHIIYNLTLLLSAIAFYFKLFYTTIFTCLVNGLLITYFHKATELYIFSLIE
ncbi:hypothetical protein ECANGB1_1 [Enterospora canceri]|uniref:Uncharacterized protein n=1 Tax=Enterospora canceri TaxID=1081671 RepID=A0A1Y1S4Q0_9MICR|nr:hypothetical protein ECANGB1_1 [Enterospora canceri]